MIELPPSEAPLLFEPLLVRLRQLGFSIGIDHHLRLQQILPGVYGQCSPEDLKLLLCPLFATNEKEQEAFYNAFDSFLPLLLPHTRMPETSEHPSFKRHPARKIGRTR